ncbi:RNA polymerase factor sigma-54 [Kangiella koreensis]|uniref:RNA polymerase sigma-54 factor n=1 Tax=Kangiella koreensis (strain DSM 16069 / JCM 12317 / KCTC 12182 / SW-125) TaxID=523791 RepID=C7R9H7_KANKD|nr:RNA polymerase factor sigma-54 [Kangiella koreensis]ACV26068.1 RNA polymerase, sigma 54 subunit, RpoN [Kangiella koreensis DSM 16069]
MNPNLQLSLSQQLKLNPQLQQSIKLLQLSQLALQQEIQYQLDNNPLLTLLDDSYCEPEAASSVSNSELDVSPLPTVFPNNRDTNNIGSLANLRHIDSGQHHSTYSIHNDGESNLENQFQESIGLREHLEWQIQMSSLSRADMEIAYYVIENIDDAGFLTVSHQEIIEQIKQDFEHRFDPDEVEAVIHQVQQLEPLGCASSNLQQFLLLQLQLAINNTSNPQQSALESALELAQRLVHHHFDYLCKHHYSKLIKRLSLTQQEMDDALSVIQCLRSKPNHQYIGEVTEYIRPDILVYNLQGSWLAQLASNNAPQLDINHQYAQALRQSNKTCDKHYLQQNLQRARWFMQSIEARNDTLKRVADWIVQHQQNFFDCGESALRPMRLKDLAEDLKLHESTISRACSDKFLQSPNGIYELKYFFSNAVPSTQGGEWSSKAIKNKIKQYVKAEPSRKPLSDIELAKMLQEEGIAIARRTVAKYREALNILPSGQRKLFTNS